MKTQTDSKHTPMRVTIVHRLNGHPQYISPNDNHHENHGTFISVDFVGSNVPKPEREIFLKKMATAVNSHEVMLGFLKHIADLAKENCRNLQDGYSMVHEWAEKAIAKAEGRE